MSPPNIHHDSGHRLRENWSKMMTRAKQVSCLKKTLESYDYPRGKLKSYTKKHLRNSSDKFFWTLDMFQLSKKMILEMKNLGTKNPMASHDSVTWDLVDPNKVVDKILVKGRFKNHSENLEKSAPNVGWCRLFPNLLVLEILRFGP